MRLFASDISPGWTRYLFLLVVLMFCAPVNRSFAQNVTLKNPSVSRDGKTLTTTLFRATDIVTIKWEQSVEGLDLKIGQLPGHYGLKTIRMRGATESSFSPEVVGLPVGVYYGVLTNSAAVNFTEIQIDASGNSAIRYSKDFMFVVESSVAPRSFNPIGNVSERVPTFEWESLPGVVSYVVMVSSTPFGVVQTVTGDPFIEGINPVWIHLTTKAAAIYGEQPESAQTADFSPLPLVPGHTYYYTIFNSYNKSDLGLVSWVSGNVETFTVQSQAGLAATQLTFPTRNIQLSNRDQVEFTWQPVTGAISYDLSIYEQTTNSGKVTNKHVFSGNTPNGFLSVSAAQHFRKGSYRWFVIANDRNGASSISDFGTFSYHAEMGGFTYRTTSATDASELLGVSVKARSTEGGYNSPGTWLASNEAAYSDSLVVGQYEFVASKSGYSTKVVPVQIRKGQISSVAIALDPLPSRISGQVIDANQAPVENVTVSFTDVSKGGTSTTKTNFSGIFSIDLSPGTFRISGSKVGYRASVPITISVNENQTLTLPAPLVVVNDNVLISGRITNQDGIAVAQAEVTATLGDQRHSIVSNGEGRWSLALSEGAWTIAASKDGFLSPIPKVLALSAGNVVENVNFVLIQQASRVEGTIYGIKTASDGRVEQVGLANATVTAYPLSGPGTAVKTDNLGRYILDLGTGFYSIFASHPDFGSSSAVDLVIRPNEIFRNVRFDLNELSSTVFGRVVDNKGVGIEGATVETSDGLSTLSQNGGTFSLKVKSGPQQLWARKKGLLQSAVVDVAPGEKAQITGLILPLLGNAASVSGVVNTRSGTIAGVLVRATNGLDVYSTYSGPNGEYRLDLPGGAWQISVLTPRYRLQSPVTFYSRAGQDAESVALTLVEDFVTISGFVTNGIDGLSEVLIRSSDVDRSRGVLSDVSTISGVGGRYTLYLSASTRYETRINRSGFEQLVHSMTTDLPGSKFSLDYQLNPAQTVLSGRVRDQEGRVVPNAVVALKIGATTLFSTQSSVDGAFQLNGESGTYDLVVSSPGYVSSSVSLELKAGQRLENISVTLESALSSLIATIIDPRTGSPLVGAQFSASGTVERTGISTAEGLVTFAIIPGGMYRVEVEAPGFLKVSRDITVPPNTTSRQTFVLVPVFGKLSGKVQDVTGGAITDATVVAEGVGFKVATQSDGNGLYTFGPLHDGGYSISAQKSGFSLSPPVSATLSISNRTVTVPNLTLVRSTGAIKGDVRNASTFVGLNGAVVIVTSQFGLKSARTDANGAFEIQGLEPGEWTLKASLSGYRFGSEAIHVANGQTTSYSVDMHRNQAVVTGRIRSKNGAALPFDVAVEIKSSKEDFSTFTTVDGRFTLEQVPQGESVVLKTRIQRENYRDIERVLDIPADGTVVNLGDLAISSLSATLSGTVGIEGVAVRVIDTAGSTIAVVTSLETGAFSVPFLEPGSYELIPSRLGYQFSPSRRSVTVLDGETANSTFSATSNLGLMTVVIRKQDGTGLPNISARISSLDRSFDQTYLSDANGQILPPQIPLGFKYLVEPSSAVHVFNPVSSELDLTSQSEVSQVFVALGVNSFLSGSTRDDAGELISDVSVTATSVLSKEYTVKSTNGVFNLGPIPPGTYTISGRKTGYKSTETTVSVGENATVSGIALSLQRQSVNIRGRITRAEAAVSGQSVALSGTVNQTVTTDSNGYYYFPNVPVLISGETILQVAIARTGRPSIVKQVSVTSANIGQTIELEEVVLSSGQITVRLFSGNTSLPGEEISILSQEGGGVVGVSDLSGQFTTPAVLEPGTYTIHLPKTTRLVPRIPLRSILLQGINGRATVDLSLPFTHVPQAVIRSDQPIFIRVQAENPESLQNRSARIRFQLPGNLTQVIEMPRVADQFEVQLPEPGVGLFTYEIEILDSVGLVEYSSALVERTTVIAGQVQDSRLYPDINAQTLRVGDVYAVNMFIRDGLGIDISSDVVARGTVEWSVISGDVEINHAQQANKLAALLTPRTVGSHAVQVKVTLSQKQIIIPIQFEAQDATVAALSVDGQSTRIANHLGSARFVVSGTTDSGRQMLLGTSVSWALSPSNVATIDQNGQITTTDAKYVGPLQIVAYDAQSGQRDSSSVAVFAELSGTEPRSLTDYGGFELFLPASAIPFKSELSLSYPRTPTQKRFDSGARGSDAVVASARTYRLALRSDRALVGDSLAAPATLTLAQDASLKLYLGDKNIGFYAGADAGWRALPSFSSDQTVVTTTATQLGDYSVVSTAADLGIQHLEVLPTSFSPEIAPLKVGYFLNTNFPPATVSVHVVNVRGELVKTLIDGDLQWSGPYGGKNGLREIEWDGTTDDGKNARNGRYILRVTAKDPSGTTSKMIPVVLVK